MKYSIDELDLIVSDMIIPKIKSNIVCLEGRMELEKQLYKICGNLNVISKISSPTFSLINEYKQKMEI